MSKIYIETFGTGEPIVMIHGWAMHSVIWQDFAEELSKHYQVSLVDLPGHGYSEVISPFTLATLCNALIQEIGDVRASWLGWSLGAEIVLEIAHRFPEKVAKLILLAGSPCFVAKDLWPGMVSSVLHGFAESLQKDSQATLLRFLALQINNVPNQLTVLKTLQTGILARPAPDQQTLQEGLNILKHSDLRTEFSNLSMPVAVILGSLDRLVPVTIGAKMQELLPALTLTVIDRAGHVPFLSHQQAVLDAVQQFMSK